MKPKKRKICFGVYYTLEQVGNIPDFRLVIKIHTTWYGHIHLFFSRLSVAIFKRKQFDNRLLYLSPKMDNCRHGEPWDDCPDCRH